MRRLVPRKLYGIQGNANEAQFTLFKADLFSNGVAVAVDHNGDVATAITISGTVTTGLLVSGAATNVISITAAASVTNFADFDALAGCVAANDVDPDTSPSDAGLGADGHIVIDIAGTPYYIPIFDTLVT